MAPALKAAEAQWLAQLASMRQAIADLNLNTKNVVANDSEYNYSYDEETSEGSGNDNIWDIVEDDLANYDSDSLDDIDEIPKESRSVGHSYGRNWLKTQCSAFAARNSGMNAVELEGQVLALLGSDSQGDYP
jgi:antiviral helicase SLH1